MKIRQSTEVNASVDSVWAILTNEYDTISKWARAANSSVVDPAANSINGSPVGGRICNADIGEVTETITVFEPSVHHLAYTAKAESMPYFVRELKGDWRLSGNDQSTAVNFVFEANLSFPFSILARGLLKKQHGKTISETLEDLKLYAETGNIHPDKS